MPITEYFHILRRRGWIIILLAVLAACSAYVFSRVQTKVYKATIVVLIKPSRSDLGLTQSAKTLLRSYVAWLNTRDNAQQVIDTLHLDQTPEALKGNVTIASDDSQFTIQIDVKDQNQKTAGDVAYQWAVLLQKWRESENTNAQRQDWVSAEVLDMPLVSLYTPQTKVNVLAGAILGVLLGGVLIFAMEYSEAGILRAPQDVERGLSLSVLGAIPPGTLNASPNARRLWAKGNSSHAK
jgi:capsular polysaccharide biosynthesis protein